MPDATLFVCEGEFVHANAINSEVFSGCVLAYTLHEFGGGVLAYPIDSNFTGTFEKGEAFFDEIYYICAVVGPDEDQNGYPDFDHPETQTSYGTEVQFLENNKFELTYTCNENSGDINIGLNLIGGHRPFGKTFVLNHNLGVDTILVNDDPISLPANTSDIELKLLNPDLDYCFDVENIDQLQQPCYFDLALRLTDRDMKVESFAPKDTVRLTIELFNQGVLPIKSTELVTYLPAGFSVAPPKLLLPKWHLNDEKDQAIYFVETVLPADSSVMISLDLLVQKEVEEGIHKPAVEIVSFQNLDGTFLTDIDSTPDRNVENDKVVDDEISDTTEDEDDHDVNQLQVVINNINKYTPDDEELWIHSISPVPVNTILNLHYQTKNNETISVSVYNTNGQVLETYTQTSTRDIKGISLNFTNYADGIYFVTLHNQKEVVSRKILKQ